MKVAIISDLHWGVRSNNDFFLKQQERFWYEFFFPYLRDKDIDTVWCLGDFFESRKQLSVKVMNHAKDFMKRFKKEGLTLYMIVGNHDVYYRNTNQISSVPPLIENLENVHLIKHPYDVIDFDGQPVAFCNWISYEDKDKVCEWIQKVDSNILCGHFEINNFEIVHGVPCRSGWFDPDYFSRFDRVLSGHFHIRSTNGLIYYVGNPYQTNWGEANDEKGFHIFDVANNEIEFVKNPFEIFATVPFDDNFDIVNFDAKVLKDKIVRLDVAPGSDRMRVNAMADKMTPFAHSIEIQEDRVVEVDEEQLNKITDTHEIIRQFLDHCNIEHLDPGLLQKLLLEIYAEALEKC